jgi:hypothetical protein
MIVRVESTSRWDALALARKLPRYRWYLVEPDPEHWHVCVPLSEAAADLPDDLRKKLGQWLRERHLDAATIHAESGDFLLTRDGPASCERVKSGSDGTRTRDLRRDRPAF